MISLASCKPIKEYKLEEMPSENCSICTNAKIQLFMQKGKPFFGHTTSEGIHHLVCLPCNTTQEDLPNSNCPICSEDITYIKMKYCLKPNSKDIELTPVTTNTASSINYPSICVEGQAIPERTPTVFSVQLPDPVGPNLTRLQRSSPFIELVIKVCSIALGLEGAFIVNVGRIILVNPLSPLTLSSGFMTVLIGVTALAFSHLLWKISSQGNLTDVQRFASITAVIAVPIMALAAIPSVDQALGAPFSITYSAITKVFQRTLSLLVI
jgi:hypothetical protein